MAETGLPVKGGCRNVDARGNNRARCIVPGDELCLDGPGHPAEGMLHIFDMKGIAISAGAACNSRQTEISHVLKAISVPRRLAECTLRISLGPGNTEEDIQRILAVFGIVAKTARRS